MLKHASCVALLAAGCLAAPPVGAAQTDPPAPAAQPATAPPPTAAPQGSTPAPDGPAPYQVIRLGDDQLSCEALVSQANQLQADLTAATMQIAKRTMRAEQAGSGASTVTSMVSGLLPYGSGALVDAAVSSAHEAAMNKTVQDAMGDAVGLQGMMDRVEHLQKLAEDKHC